MIPSRNLILKWWQRWDLILCACQCHIGVGLIPITGRNLMRKSSKRLTRLWNSVNNTRFMWALISIGHRDIQLTGSAREHSTYGWMKKLSRPLTTIGAILRNVIKEFQTGMWALTWSMSRGNRFWAHQTTHFRTACQSSQKVVKAIRDVDPDRLIIADGMWWGRDPSEDLADLNIAQSTRGYETFADNPLSGIMGWWSW